MSASLATAAASANASLATEVAGLVGEASSTALTPEVDMLEAYMIGIEQGMANLKHGSAVLDDSLGVVLDAVGLGGGQPATWNERLAEAFWTAQGSDMANIEALVDSTERIAEKLSILMEAFAATQATAYDVDVALTALAKATTTELSFEEVREALPASTPSESAPPEAGEGECGYGLRGSVEAQIDMQYSFVVVEEEGGAQPSAASRRQLLAKKAGPSDTVREFYTDYTKHDDWTLPDAGSLAVSASTPSESQARYVALQRNRLVGGLLLHVQRRREVAGSVCTQRFAHLARRCFSENVVEKYGADTVFVPGRALYRLDLQDDVGEYYDIAPGSDALDSNTLTPKPFTARPLRSQGATPGVPLVIDTGLGARRAQELYTFIDDGFYFDPEASKQALATMVTWNSQTQAWAILKLDWTRPHLGTWQVGSD